jgi:hypothetical protein
VKSNAGLTIACMLTRYQIESELSVAYLHAIAAKASFAVDIPHIDNDSIDAIISAKGKLVNDSIKHSPRIQVQLKATINTRINNGEISYPLPIKNYDDLRVDTAVPRLLVLLVLPEHEIDWLVHHPEKLIFQKCAYYLNLKGQPEKIGIDKPTIYIPTSNMLTPVSLRDLMIKASKLQDL